MDNRKAGTRVFMTADDEDPDTHRRADVFGNTPTPEVTYVTERTAQEVERAASDGTKTTTITYVTKLKPVAKPPTTWAKGHRAQKSSLDIGLWD
jgi:hypothetical protein